MTMALTYDFIANISENAEVVPSRMQSKKSMSGLNGSTGTIDCPSGPQGRLYQVQLILSQDNVIGRPGRTVDRTIFEVISVSP